MAKGSKQGACSAHVEPVKANCLQHARREGKVPSYVNPHLTANNRTVFEDQMIAGRKSIMPLLKQAAKLYTAKTGQKCQKSFTPFREDVLKLKAGITDQQLMNFKAKVEQETGWKVVAIWLHQDEGHYHSKYIEGDEDFDLNIHAHVLYSCQDPETGKAIRLNRNYFRLRQDWLAEATGMERGNPAIDTGRKHRSAMQQRIVSQEQRIAELERTVEAYNDEIANLEDERRKAVKAAQAKTWNGVANLFGHDRAVNELKAQINAVEAERDAERENYKVELEKARSVAKNGLQKALRKIGAAMDLYKKTFTVDQIIAKIREIQDAKNTADRMNTKLEAELKALKQDGEQQDDALHVHR